jgi:hypothetical protein
MTEAPLPVGSGANGPALLQAASAKTAKQNIKRFILTSIAG